MARETPITTEGEIIEVLDERSYRATLPNGKIIHAHIPLGARGESPLAVGDRVCLQLNPYDFSRARIRPSND